MPVHVAKNTMNGIIVAKRTMQQKKKEYAWPWRVFVERVFVDSVPRREMKGDGWEGGRRGKMELNVKMEIRVDTVVARTPTDLT